MVQNIDSILQRGERLDLLVDKTDTLAGQAYAFRRGARSVRRQQWWKNTRITFLTGVVVVVRPSRLTHHTAHDTCWTDMRIETTGHRRELTGS
jgi:vesicle-associated membrane protein 7